MNSKFYFILVYLGFVWFCCAMPKDDFTKTIIVGKKGKIQFHTVQSAIDSIPNDNHEWIKIHVLAGIYRETVRIPKTKEFILLEGEGRERTTIVQSKYINAENLHLSPINQFKKGFISRMNNLEDSATFVSEANNIMVEDITFKNDFTESTGLIKRAVAADIKGDKTSFYNCGFISFQDTLLDRSGRHYFSNCYIEGHVDYIFGFGQSIYERCTIYSTSVKIGSRGWITAQGRKKPTDPDGFVFKYCNLVGPGLSYLGRAWGPYSKVVFYRSTMTNIIVPEGWDQWSQKTMNLEFSEYDNTGPGSNLTSRVNWMKTLSNKDIDLYHGFGFIDNEGWINNQPK